MIRKIVVLINPNIPNHWFGMGEKWLKCHFRLGKNHFCRSKSHKPPVVIDTPIVIIGISWVYKYICPNIILMPLTFPSYSKLESVLIRVDQLRNHWGKCAFGKRRMIARDLHEFLRHY